VVVAVGLVFARCLPDCLPAIPYYDTGKETWSVRRKDTEKR